MDVPFYHMHLLGHAERSLFRALEECSLEELKAQPIGPNTNSIGFVIWHLSRIQDMNTSRQMGKKQAWESEGWAEKFGKDPTDLKATGFTSEEAAGFDPVSAQLLREYYECVRGYTEKYVSGLTPEVLDTPIENPPPGRPYNLGTSIALALGDSIQHFGQIGILMGVIREHGWYESGRAH